MVSAESFWEAIRQSRTTRVILPGDEQDLERAAQGYLASLTPEQWGQLDQVLQDQVLGPLGGLHRGCISCSDLVRTLGVPLVEEAAQFLGTCLPVTDVAQVEIEVAGGRNDSLVKRAKMYFNQATPVPAEPKEANPRSYLLIPASDFGKRYGEEVAQAIPGLRIVRVPGQADLMFCREREAFSIEDLDQVLQPCRHAYDKVVSVPQASPHARFDILDWLPLAP
jgi:hypothetical protein